MTDFKIKVFLKPISLFLLGLEDFEIQPNGTHTSNVVLSQEIPEG